MTISNEAFILLGMKIKTLRLQQGFTQIQLSRKIGFCSSYIGNLEKGNANISFVNLLKLAKGLGVEAEYLVKDL